ncbi:MAG: hypothetical protein IT423_04865 [Pirellulaceae bacterium]|nr:hypothetical protein [Pirellulaceae bacterium]
MTNSMPSDSSPPSSLQLLALLPLERQGDWLDACLLYGGGHEIEITQVSSTREMAAELRQFGFDLLVFWCEGAQGPSATTCAQLLELADHSGFLALGMHAVEAWQHAVFSAGAVACVDMDTADPVSLVHTVRTACELLALRHERHQWQTEKQRITERESRDVQRLLAGQRQLLCRLDELGGNPSISSPTYAAGDYSTTDYSVRDMGPAEFREEFETAGQEQHAQSFRDPRSQTPSGSADHLLATTMGHSYCAVLHNYLFDQSQVSSAAITLLAENFLANGADSSSIMRLHLAAVTRVTAHSGPGALKHCLSSADRFLMELLMRLVDRRENHSSVTPALARTRPAASPLAAA